DSHGNSTSERDSAVANEWVDLPARLKEQKGMRNLPATAARCSVWWSLPFWPARQVIKAVLCEVPAARAQHLEIAPSEPCLGGLPGRDRQQRSLACRTPGVRAGGISVVAPEEADRLARVDGVGDVGAYEADTLPAVLRTNNLVSHATLLRP